MMNMQNIMKQAQMMQRKMEEAQAKLAETEVEGSAGGGMVKVTITGKANMKKISIDKSLMNANEVDILEDLIIAAFNDAKTKADTLTESSMSGITGGIKLPF